ncbi:MerR family transcriptional regulator [Celeribacter indicus]|uniref:HTH merR-type domain-containing protein n=1 Tax=Celeribacter indicus TaxID=1208324 RepID=A0A0B5E2Z3_9RHOB|nr:MerR family transcriptional regulator [Celeribacter indicus]AJE47396.1 hypothetical protein P73_2681 [Celeribacter indicus]SDW05483.1 MerR HTH family regulatory protein [Celeribacter indicus]
MDKSPDAFRTISEVADWLDTPAHVLRFWESRFTQVKPVKRAGGRRYYRPADMALLGGIKKLLHDDGMTIRGVQKLLREHGVKYVASLSPAIDGTPSDTPAPRPPIPSAPMAENVPQDRFEAEDTPPGENVLPFARPAGSEATPGAQSAFDFGLDTDTGLPEETGPEAESAEDEAAMEPHGEDAAPVPLGGAEDRDSFKAPGELMDDAPEAGEGEDWPQQDEPPLTEHLTVPEQDEARLAGLSQFTAPEDIVEEPLRAEESEEPAEAPETAQEHEAPAAEDLTAPARADTFTGLSEFTAPEGIAEQPLRTDTAGPVPPAAGVPLGADLPLGDDLPDEAGEHIAAEGVLGRLDRRRLAALPQAEISALCGRIEALRARLAS